MELCYHNFSHYTKPAEAVCVIELVMVKNTAISSKNLYSMGHCVSVWSLTAARNDQGLCDLHVFACMRELLVRSETQTVCAQISFIYSLL